MSKTTNIEEEEEEEKEFLTKQEYDALIKAELIEITLYEKSLEYIILTSRFNNETWNKNKQYRLEHNIKCIYGTPITINKNIPYKKKCLVLEMNNDINRIMGIGIIQNIPCYNKNQIYNNSCDLFNYYSNEWINIYDNIHLLKHNELLTIRVLESLCFYGNNHLKRGNGLKRFPTKYLFRLQSHLNIINIILQMQK